MAGASADGCAPSFVIGNRLEVPDGFDTNSEFSVQIPISESVGVNGIADGAFHSCRGLRSVVFPEGVTRIGDSAFYDCSSLTAVGLPKGVTKIGWGTFAGCSSLTAVVLPKGVTHIGNCAFNGCSSLTAVVLPKGVTEIGWGAFASCSSLTAVVLPKGVTEIGWGAFAGCSSLTAVDMPKGVTEIHTRTFARCSWLVVVSLHSPLPMGVYRDAFDSCDRLTLVVAPRGSGLVGSLVGGVTVVEDTEANRRSALDLQYWRVRSHGLCSPERRSWVRAVLFVANRLRGGPLTLPREMWYMILDAIQRCQLGPAL
jgi:hypothetical protein